MIKAVALIKCVFFFFLTKPVEIFCLYLEGKDSETWSKNHDYGRKFIENSCVYHEDPFYT